MEGQIIKIVGNIYYVKSDNKIIECFCKGTLKKDKNYPIVGDIVLFDINDKIIKSILPRKNTLIRPRVSNIDQAFIITSLKSPDFSTNLLDKLLVILEFNRIKPIICLTKEDLLDKDEKEELNKIIDYYKSIGYIIVSNKDISKIKELLSNKLSVFTGQTGSGKSTLLNKLCPELNLKTNEISLALGRGKHTTTNVELYEIDDAKVLDTPGFSAIEFIDMTNQDIRDNFIEFNDYTCAFRDCNHINEKGCMIKQQVEEEKILKSRYENYLKFIRR